MVGGSLLKSLKVVKDPMTVVFRNSGGCSRELAESCSVFSVGHSIFHAYGVLHSCGDSSDISPVLNYVYGTCLY